MEIIAFYLKYRPQHLSELIGQEAVKKILLSSFPDKLSHAYLFVGPRGTGKTSTARILAKMVNCEKGNLQIPCNQCSNCLSITDGSNLDLIEIDAASNRGIEDIRSLREKIKLSPTSSRKKVYIIDEVHMLTTEAFNALLKTLEEPPKHALFILATTEVSKIPQTILSRVQRLDFKLAGAKEIMETLEKIIKKEKIDIEEEALKILIRKADGSFRDAVKLLDQISTFKGKITVKDLEEVLKSSRFEELITLTKDLLGHKTPEALLNITKQQENGIDPRELMVSLMDFFRQIIFIKNGLGEQLVAQRYTGEKYEQMLTLSLGLSAPDLIRMLNILQNYLEKFKTSSTPSLPLELAVVEICEIGSIIKKSSGSESLVPQEQQVAEVKKSKFEDREKTEEFPEIENTLTIIPPVIIDAPADSNLRSDNDSPDIKKLKEKWTFVLETIRPVNFSLEALLRSINLRDCTAESVILEVPYSFHQRILEAPKNRDLLESILSDILGRKIKISISLGSRPERKEDIANIELAADDDIIRAAAEIFNSDTIN